jgi:hypothetical protein
MLGSGVIQFASRNRGDGARVARDSIAPTAIAALLPAAVRLGVFQLPSVVAQAPELCPDYATDHSTVTVSIYGSGRVKRIVDYQGCFLRSDHSTASRLDNLRLFESLVDSVAGSRRWVQPNRIR